MVVQIRDAARQELWLDRLAVRISYDSTADAAMIRLVEDSSPQHSLMCDVEFDEAAVILILNDQDKLVGIEVLGAAKILPSDLRALS